MTNVERIFVILLGLLAFSSQAIGETLEFPLSQILTPTPVETLNYQNRDLDSDLLPIFEELMTVTTNCRLPCWWGLQPGVTTVKEIMTFLQETGFDRDWHSGSALPLEEYLREGEPFGLDFIDRRFRPIYAFGIAFHIPTPYSQLRRIDVEFNWLNEWPRSVVKNISLPQVLGQMDTLPEIFIPGSSSDSNYALHVIYKDEGVWINYAFDLLADQLTDEPSLCFNLEQTKSVKLRLGKPDDAALAYEYEAIQNSTAAYYSLDDLYDIDVETFRQFFIDHPNDCPNPLVS